MAVKTQTELNAQKEAIRIETAAKANTAQRIGVMFGDFLDTVFSLLGGKQPTLVSGTNIKTVNGTSLLGTGDLSVSGGSGTSDSPIVLTYSGSQTFTLPKTITEAVYFLINNGTSLRAWGYNEHVTKNGNEATFTGLQTGDKITLWWKTDGTNITPSVTLNAPGTFAAAASGETIINLSWTDTNV